MCTERERERKGEGGALERRQQNLENKAAVLRHILHSMLYCGIVIFAAWPSGKERLALYHSAQCAQTHTLKMHEF